MEVEKGVGSVDMYELFYRIDRSDTKAPSKVDLDGGYEPGGSLTANTRGEAARKWFTGDVEDAYSEAIKPPTTGDIIRDPFGGHYILTPEGLWALVSVE